MDHVHILTPFSGSIKCIKSQPKLSTPKNPDEYIDIHYNSPTPGRIGVEPAELGGQADCLRETGKV